MIKKSLICLLSCLSINASAADEQTEFLKMIVVGHYDLIGKTEVTGKTYSGKVSIALENDQLIVKRQVNGDEVTGKGDIEPAAGGDARVLRIHYTDQGQKAEQTCLVHGDLDNYARISCYVYLAKDKTKRLGMEALFHAN